MNDSLREILVTDVPPAFVTRLLSAAEWVYKEAHDTIKNNTMLGEAERAYLEPHYRRALFERKMLEVALDSGLKAVSEQVASGAAKYNLVRVGRLLLTCSKTSGRYVVPRACSFRGQYSDINEHIDQGQLFPVQSAPQEASLYCIVTHGPSTKNPGTLGYCCFGFPAMDMEKWAQQPIDLADIRDYQQQRYQKADDDRAQIQQVEPKLKPQFEADGDAEEKA
ncbi:hypothetical protein GCM10011521_17820 [Arenimonas soli]|uniref:Uncharacterized protein n=1 Tax=Arenimonas soli TaxID=2269504 RepID=A0ABQ1HK75_9GAMM|nr:hypothetical protein [Arenimonas soli]GGA80009.1 hypothetical protein GCM10011521_17820 [Arenimonas soli]